MTTIIGVDVGGTLLRAGRFDNDLTLLERAEQFTHTEEGADAVFDRLVETIQQVMPESPDERVGVGVVLPGPVDMTHGMLINPPNLPFRDFPIGPQLQQALGCPVYIGNDADLAGLAEYRIGAGVGSRHLIYLTVSTGVGGGIILDGEIITGGGRGGEIGHMVVLPDGPMCGCGHQGHLEAVSSGTGIARIARERLAAGEASALHDVVDDIAQIRAKHVGEAAVAGDPLALSIITDAGRYLGVAIASLMMILNPDRFVLGGGVTKVGDLLFDPMREAIAHYAMHPMYWEDVPILPAALQEDIGLMGAAALVERRQHAK